MKPKFAGSVAPSAAGGRAGNPTPLTGEPTAAARPSNESGGGAIGKAGSGAFTEDVAERLRAALTGGKGGDDDGGADGLAETQRQSAPPDGGRADPAGDAAGDDGAGGARAAPKSLSEAAEALGLEVAELYALDVPVGDNGEVLSLGELKDAWKAGKDLKAERLAFTRDSEKGRDELAKARAEISRLAGMLPAAAFAPDNVSRMRVEAEAEMAREWSSMIAAEPSWKDAKAYQSDFAEMVKVGEAAGYTKRELELVTDHRAYRLLLKLTRLTKAVEGALEGMKPREKRGGGEAPAVRRVQTEKEATATARRARLASSGRDGQIKAISELLTG